MAAVVLQLSDIHLTARPGGPVSGYDPDARLSVVLDAWLARGQTPDLVLLTGDNTDDGSAEGYRRLLAAVEPLGAPVLAVAGNHDRPTAMVEVFGSTIDAEVGAWRIVGVDSSRPAQVHGTVDVAATVARLDAHSAVDERPTVLAIHHPPTSGSWSAATSTTRSRPRRRSVRPWWAARRRSWRSPTTATTTRSAWPRRPGVGS
jgi:Icc protein